MTFGCVLLTMGRRPDDLRQALDSLLAQRGRRDSTSSWSATSGSRPGCPTACAASARPRTSASRPGATSASRTRSGELLFFLDDDASLAAPRRARARSRAASPTTRSWGCCSCASPRATAAPRRATGCRGCGSATARARATSPRCGRARWRCGAASSRPSAAGRRTSASSTRASTSAWRVMDAGLSGRLRGRHRRAAPVADRHAARLLLLLRGAQPGLAGPPPPAAPARGPLRRRLRAAHAPAAALGARRARGAARVPRRPARPRRRAPAAAGAHLVADDTRRSTPDHVSLLA